MCVYTQDALLHVHVVLLILTVVDCGVLTNPANGQVSHPTETAFRQTATYSCNTGYNLVGDSARTCQPTGKWSGSEPTCQSMLQTGYINRHVCMCEWATHIPYTRKYLSITTTL